MCVTPAGRAGIAPDEYPGQACVNRQRGLIQWHATGISNVRECHRSPHTQGCAGSRGGPIPQESPAFLCLITHGASLAGLACRCTLGLPTPIRRPTANEPKGLVEALSQLSALTLASSCRREYGPLQPPKGAGGPTKINCPVRGRWLTLLHRTACPRRPPSGPYSRYFTAL